MNAGEEIVNPRTGQRMIFRQTAGDTGGALLRIETFNPRGPAEPEHVHPLQESNARVLAGALHFNVRGRVQVVRAGETIVIPANTPHNFWNDGEEVAQAIQEFRPALRTEDFFETYFALARDGKLNAQGMPPSLLHLAVLTAAYWEVIRVTRPPVPVQRIFATLLAPLGRWRGYRAQLTPERGAM
ncbi:MAG: cupin domain-containing protein [Chloroflexia bacterium]